MANNKTMVFDTTTMMMFCAELRRSDGSIDVESAVAKFRGNLERMVAERETEESVYSLQVDAVFDRNPIGKYMSSDLLVHYVLQSMNPSHDAFAIVSARLKEYLKENSSGNLEDRSALFHVKKGTGIARRRDL